MIEKVRSCIEMKVNQFTTNISIQNSFTDMRSRQSVDPALQKKWETFNQQVKKEDVLLAVDNVNDFLEPVSTNLKFVFHEDLNDYYVTVVDPLTNEVIREIPPRKMLDMYVAMAEYMGLLVDEKI